VKAEITEEGICSKNKNNGEIMTRIRTVQDSRVPSSKEQKMNDEFQVNEMDSEQSSFHWTQTENTYKKNVNAAKTQFKTIEKKMPERLMAAK